MTAARRGEIGGPRCVYSSRGWARAMDSRRAPDIYEGTVRDARAAAYLISQRDPCHARMSIVCLSHVMQHSEAKGGSRLVLFVLAEHAHDDGSEAYPAVTTIAERARMSRKGVQVCLRKLEEDGHIERDGSGPRGQTKWRVLVGGEQSTPRVNERQGGRNPRPGGGVPRSPEPTPEPSVEPSFGVERVRASESTDVVGDLFDYWRGRCGHPTAKATRERTSKVQARLREGYTPDQIRTAIDGAARAAFVNDAGKRFDDLELICRNGTKLEDFIGRADLPLHSNVEPLLGRDGKTDQGALMRSLLRRAGELP